MKKMRQQTSVTRTKKRTQIKDLSDSDKTLNARELKNIKGGIVGPCTIPRLSAVGPCNKPKN